MGASESTTKVEEKLSIDSNTNDRITSLTTPSPIRENIESLASPPFPPVQFQDPFTTRFDYDWKTYLDSIQAENQSWYQIWSRIAEYDRENLINRERSPNPCYDFQHKFQNCLKEKYDPVPKPHDHGKKKKDQKQERVTCGFEQLQLRNCLYSKMTPFEESVGPIQQEYTYHKRCLLVPEWNDPNNNHEKPPLTSLSSPWNPRDGLGFPTDIPTRSKSQE